METLSFLTIIWEKHIISAAKKRVKFRSAHCDFFIDEKHRHHTIVLTPGCDPNSQLQGFHSICTNVPETQLIKELMSLQRSGHPHGEHLPMMDSADSREKNLTDREIEVLSLVAQGKINKEIADQLCIGLTTVITHRKNIQEKLYFLCLIILRFVIKCMFIVMK